LPLFFATKSEISSILSLKERVVAIHLRFKQQTDKSVASATKEEI
jgi:hypothetical protein